MGNGYKRPLDRPSKIYCKTCGSWRPMNHYTTTSGHQWPPDDLTGFHHKGCPTNSMIYVWDDVLPVIPSRLSSVSTPVCGDPQCDGTCTNLQCLPSAAPKPLVKSVTSPPLWVRLAIGIALWAIPLIVWLTTSP